MRALILTGGIVTNVIVVEADTDLTAFGALPAPNDEIGIGWVLKNGNYEPPVPTPDELVAMLDAQKEAARTDPILALKLAAQGKIDIALARTAALAVTMTAFENVGKNICKDYTDVEQAGWTTKAFQAAACLGGEPQTHWPMIAAEASLLGIEPQVLAGKVATKAQQFSLVTSLISAHMAKIRAAIAGAETPQTVVTIRQQLYTQAMQSIASAFAPAPQTPAAS